MIGCQASRGPWVVHSPALLPQPGGLAPHVPTPRRQGLHFPHQCVTPLPQCLENGSARVARFHTCWSACRSAAIKHGVASQGRPHCAKKAWWSVALLSPVRKITRWHNAGARCCTWA
jgi:hypothetical protein